MLELLVAISIASILMSAAVYNFKDFHDPVQSATDEIIAFFKLVRSKAISNTQAYRFEPNGSDAVKISYRDTCTSSDPWVENSELSFELQNGAQFTDTDWFVCLDSRGFPDANLVIAITDGGDFQEIEIFLGGSIATI